MNHSKAKELLAEDLGFGVPELRLELCTTDHPELEPQRVYRSARKGLLRPTV